MRYATTNLARLLVSQNWFGPTSFVFCVGRCANDEDWSGFPILRSGGQRRWCADGSRMPLAGLGRSTSAAQQRSRSPSNASCSMRKSTARSRHAWCWARLPARANWIISLPGSARLRMSFILRFDNCVVSFSCRPAQHIEIRGIRSEQDAALLSAKQAGATTLYQAFYLEWMDFLAGVRNRQPSKFSARSALATVRAVEMLYTEGKRAAGKRSI